MPGSQRLVILISGRGSNLQAILEGCRDGVIDGRVVAVISNRADAGGIETAARAGIETAIIDHKHYGTREEFDHDLLDQVLAFAPDYVVLAGFMRILTPVFVRPLIGKLINIHPSLLPKYPGLNTHRRALEAGDRESGATVHFVTEHLDSGPAIVQCRVPVLPGDTEEALAARILNSEHRLYVEALRLLCAGRIELRGDGALMDGEPLPASGVTATEH